ncbi:maleylpyruvate isomerase family mycothiol-dependent enzyme [Streptomyces sp. NPDC059002]|uniref:maleylpyruvate isomerase family mycothiol-dependent enzyme n=1 Tax=Streptomyces sp. NPDC059002 TaxID=3346690 RepID=UPI0036B9AFE0
MTTDHEEVRRLLGAWAVDALLPGDERRIADHLPDCAACSEESRRLRDTVRYLDGVGAGHQLPGGGGPAESAQARPRPRDPSGEATDMHVLSLAFRTRAPALRTAPHAEPYAAAVAGLQALLGEMDERGAWGTPVVHDWDVHDTVAHLIAADEPLALRLGLHARVPASRVSEGTPWRAVWAARTSDVIAHERRREPARTVATWRNQAAGLLATPAAHDTELAARPAVLMGVRLPVADHFLVRAFEAWVHADDIGRALDRHVPPPPVPHLWRLVRLAVRILGIALGEKAPPVALTVAGEGGRVEWILGDTGDAVRAELVLDPVDFCLLVGGRRAPEEVPRGVSGDTSAAWRVLTRAASLSWL